MKIQPNVLLDLHKNWTPHPGQIPPGQALFQKGRKLIFLQCGRKWGKSEFVIYCLWRWCNTHAGQVCYYVAPFINQAREIVWAAGRIQNFGPKQWIKKELNNEMRLVFWNDSFIKLSGADNSQALRGINPNFAVYDEYKDFQPGFHASFGPNLLTNRAPLIAIGTPPENDASPSEINYIHLADEAREREDGFFRLAPSWERNNDPDFLEDLERTRKILINRGEEDVWLREYGAQFCRAGQKVIFPMLAEHRHKRSLGEILSEIRQNEDAWEFWCVADPGSGSVFAVGFFALNRYIPKIYMLREIYAQDAGEMSAGRIYPRIEENLPQLSTYPPNSWHYVYDEAALWFLREVNNHHTNHGWMPSHKAEMRGESNDAGAKPYLGMLKDMFNEDMLIFSDECPKAWHEFSAYQKDKNGNIPKKNDHCVAASMLVDTLEGPKRIDEMVGRTGEVFSFGGLEAFSSVRPTASLAPLITITFEDGRFVTVTPDHLLLRSDGVWVPARFLVEGEEVSCYGPDNHQRNNPRISRESLLSLWKLLQRRPDGSCSATAQGCLGAPSRADTSENSYSSQKRESSRQPDRQSRSTKRLRAHDSSPSRSGSPSEASGMGLGESPQLTEGSQRVGEDSSGEGAFSKTRGDQLGESSLSEEGLRFLWANLLHQKLLWEVLPSQLQDEHASLEANRNKTTTARVARIVDAGTGPVYNLEVATTHCFSIQGGILVHNCIDLIRYLLHNSAFAMVGDEEPDNRVLTLPRTTISYISDDDTQPDIEGMMGGFDFGDY